MSQYISTPVIARKGASLLDKQCMTQTQNFTLDSVSLTTFNTTAALCISRKTDAKHVVCKKLIDECF